MLLRQPTGLYTKIQNNYTLAQLIWVRANYWRSPIVKDIHVKLIVSEIWKHCTCHGLQYII